jgi:hypothetical protein
MMPDEPAAKATPAKPIVKPVAAAPGAVTPPVAAPAGGGAAPPAGGAAAPEEPRAKKFVARVDKNLEKPKAEKPAAAKGPGRLEVAVAPWGDVLVDGRNRGRAPPLLVLEVPPGSHKIEIRNATSPAHVAQVEVKPGETVRIQHRFR